MVDDHLQDEIKGFLSGKRIAIVGLSTQPADFSCAILDKLEVAGFEVYGVNPRLEEDAEQRRYRALRSIPGPPVDGVFITTPPDAALGVVQECAELGVERVWMHQNFGQGSTSAEAVAFCKEHGIHVIDRGCPMMFVEPVDLFHRTMRWCKGMRPVAAS